MRNDTKELIRAAEMSRNGHHRSAANIYQRLGNKDRNPSEKKELWKQAERSRRLAD